MPLDAGEKANIVTLATDARDSLDEALAMLAQPTYAPLPVLQKLNTAEALSRKAKEAFMTDYQD